LKEILTEPAGVTPKDKSVLVVPVSVAFGIIITTLTLCGVGFGSSIWWASSISTKMDLLVKQGVDQVAATLALNTRITALELWKEQIVSVGSPETVKRLVAHDQEIRELRRDFDLHKATTMKP